MADNVSTLYAKAVAEAQRAAQHVLDNAPGAYEKGKEAALITAAKVQPALDSAIERKLQSSSEGPSHSAKSLLDILGPIVRQNPYSSLFGVWAALAVIFGPLWPVRALLRIFGFGKGVTPGSNAAAWQSRQGNVQRKSWFSLFQSYGDRLN
ncbi:hypothetical protein EYC80_003879 [Monilinia laxa]|uniref:Uncharacterized protein n=1 Tax=Monilinia laxa TaxID=61186 RepID=A0A5N6KL19_MONLA|nr:hypothetical protein EYC80_003879 [Monilinia laxa]